MKMFVILAVSLLPVACQTASGEFYSANKQSHGVAQFVPTSAYAGPETSAGSLASANKNANGVAQFAKAPVAVTPVQDEASEVAAVEAAPAAAPAETKADCPAVTLKSTTAAGQPCLTTEAFIASLKLSKAQQKKALAALKKARDAAAH